MSLLGTGVMATWIEVAPKDRDNFCEWHTREHMPERLCVDGFRRGRRYVAVEAEITYFIFYETRDIDVLTGPEYRGQLNNPTPWSARTVLTFGKNIRGVCDVRFSKGHANGGFLAVVSFDAPGALPGPSPYGDALAPLLDRAQVSGAHLLVCDPVKSNTKTALQSHRKIALPDHIALIEGCSASAVTDAAQVYLKSAPLAQTAGATFGVYQLECSLDKAS